MTSIVVDIADMKIASGDGNELVTHALGACIAVAVYDPVSKVGGMLHYMLPEASFDPEKARESPFLFADTAIPLLFRAAYRAGAMRSRLIVRLAGGADVMDESHLFNIGKCNYLAARRIFFRNNILVASELVGGVSGKSMRMRLQDGQVEIRLPGGEIRTL